MLNSHTAKRKLFGTCLQIIFEGITGSSYTGDVAIDQVNVTEEKCPGKICLLFKPEGKGKNGF